MDRRQYMKKYYETKHQDKNIRRICECGDNLGYYSLHHHKKTDKHFKNLAKKNEQSTSSIISDRTIYSEGS